ncbi:hypothetical protein ASC89_21485 [Devosia sp. Root413D1]|uniref:hypothetical protein n=1 Tax=Devosia sp. Root413D1 TaxID=1736531 RepID=UPI0006F7AD9B|nr:hypothetical protein [Devosia sp. Root413D1]KQW77732.1 hypothetical protein ASC89_21485 [Devosia sp. Root413D1]
MRAFFVLLLGLLASTAQGQEAWTVYRNAACGYAVEYPAAGFDITETDTGLTLIEQDAAGQIDIYCATNAERRSPAGFEQVLAGAERIREITYSRNGRSWLAVSGYYQADQARGDDLIFYAKFMFSPDLSQLSAFEASYPAGERQRFDAIVERMEDSLTAPRAAD